MSPSDDGSGILTDRARLVCGEIVRRAGTAGAACVPQLPKAGNVAQFVGTFSHAQKCFWPILQGCRFSHNVPARMRTRDAGKDAGHDRDHPVS